ncbi:MAG: hypothetical protein H6732_19305 [Alphaproteobacteria bacterium]|nr:hypothetical protein [Alphaproteobacteria bacterium]
MLAALGVAAGLAVVEGVARLAGHAPHAPVDFPLRVEPPGWLADDAEAGWTLAPGSFHARFADGTGWTATHPARGRRLVPGSGGPHRVVLLGDSVPYGWGVDDDQTVAAHLARALPHTTVELRAVPGHSLAQTWVVLRQLLAREPGAVVILGYASWLDERTVWARHWQRSLAAFTREGPLGAVAVPWVRDPERPAPTPGGRLRYAAWPGEGWSAAVAWAAQVGEARELRGLQPERVAVAVLRAMGEEAARAGTGLVVVGLAGDDATRARLASVASTGLAVLQADVDLRAAPWSLLPRDPHLSPAGHARLAEVVLGHLGTANDHPAP